MFSFQRYKMGNTQGLASKPSVIGTSAQNNILCFLRVLSAAQSTSTPQLFGTRYNFLNASPNNTSAMPMKIGRYGSSAVR